MKLNIDIKNKKGSLDSDVEKLIEKGMDLHEKDWKDKFNAKHKIIEENRKTKEIELEDRRKREEAERIERQKVIKMKIIFTIILGILTIVLFTLGSFLGYASGDPNSGWYVLFVLGICTGMAIICIWISGNESNGKGDL